MVRTSLPTMSGVRPDGANLPPESRNLTAELSSFRSVCQRPVESVSIAFKRSTKALKSRRTMGGRRIVSAHE